MMLNIEKANLKCALLYSIHHVFGYIKYESYPLTSPTFPFPYFLQCLPLLSQILKLYAWEPSFQTQVEGIRDGELKVMKKFAYLTSVSTFIFSCAPALVSAVKEPPRKPKAAGQQRWFWFLILSFPLRYLWSHLQCS